MAKSGAKPKRRQRQTARLAELFKVLSKPNRLKIIALPLEYEELTVNYTGLQLLFDLFFPNITKAKVDIAGIEATLKKSWCSMFHFP